MSSYLSQKSLLELLPNWKHDEEAASSLLNVILALALTLGTWRIWKFSILPAIRPLEPKELPYWIPCE